MKNNANLIEQLISEKKELLILRFKNKSGQLKETHLIRKTRKNIAFLCTKIHSSEDNKNV